MRLIQLLASLIGLSRLVRAAISSERKLGLPTRDLRTDEMTFGAEIQAVFGTTSGLQATSATWPVISVDMQMVANSTTALVVLRAFADSHSRGSLPAYALEL
jgi:hypothetical protein